MRGSRNFYKGGGGGGGGGGERSRSDSQKTAWTTIFLVLNLFYSLQRGYNGFITEKTNIIFPKIQYFPGGGGGGPTCT